MFNWTKNGLRSCSVKTIGKRITEILFLRRIARFRNVSQRRKRTSSSNKTLELKNDDCRLPCRLPPPSVRVFGKTSFETLHSLRLFTVFESWTKLYVYFKTGFVSLKFIAKDKISEIKLLFLNLTLKTFIENLFCLNICPKWLVKHPLRTEFLTYNISFVVTLIKSICSFSIANFFCENIYVRTQCWPC